MGQILDERNPRIVSMSPKPRINLINIVVTTIISLVMTEAILRVILALRIGPDLIFYGTPYNTSEIGKDWQQGVPTEDFFEETHNVAQHANERKNYSKYFPGQKRSDTDEHGAVFEVLINSHGFRGKDYTVDKPKDLLRIACLGDSATFGYGNREHQTYPAYLEEILTEHLPKMKGGYHRVEVLNFGIPHMLMENMYSIFIHEVLPVKPDVVTIYAGMFDTGQKIDLWIHHKNQQRKENPREITAAQLLDIFFRQDLPDHVLTAKLVNTVFRINRRRGFDPEHVKESFAYRNTDEFLGYLTRIKKMSDENGIKFFVMTQQAQSEFFSEKYKGNITYQEEVNRIEHRAKKKRITKDELRLLHHNWLMKEIRAWAVANSVPLIDGQAVLDPHRNYIWHWVHILPVGNKILAGEMARRVIEENRQP